jgi:hypothetical protein
VELVPESENRFVIQENQSRVVFERDRFGKAARLVVEHDGESQSAPRTTFLKPEELTKRIQDYIGKYYSDELETSYEVKVRDNELMVAHLRLGEAPLTAARSGDKFQGQAWFSFQVVFTRDNAGMVTGFRLSTHRTQNVLFQRAARSL